MSIKKCGGGGVAPSKISKKQRIACFIVGIALFTGLSLVFVTCRAEPLNYAEENKDFRRKDTIPSDYTVTFKNGWETEIYDGEMKDDPYTEKYNIHLSVTPVKIKAAYDETEKLEYDEALENYNQLLKDMADYEARRDRGDPDAENFLPEDPIEPVAPTASLPFFPGSPIINDEGEEVIAGRQPEWDFHTFIGWKIYPAYPDSDGAYELTLTGAITANVTAVAQWVDAPARPFKEITFEKADGSGVFEKRLAIPTKFAYEPDNLAGTDSVAWDHDNDFNTPDIYITYDEDNAKKDGENPIILKYEDFQIPETYLLGETITQNEPRVPVFTRDHYDVSATPWKDSEGVSIDPLGNFADNAFVYQQWSPKQYIITFNTNGIGSLNSVLGNLDAPTVAQSGLVGVGEQLPLGGTVTHTDAKEYTFSYWTDAPVGGNRYYNTTPITGSTELYAQWDVAGGAKYTFGSTGNFQTFTVPTTGTYKIEAWGAQGGGEWSRSTRYNTGGYGGYAMGTISLNAGGTLYVYVGAQGADGVTTGNGGNGGYNGGGKGGNGIGVGGRNGAGGGGGASDVRLVGGGGAWNNEAGLRSRIIVAGGGGSVGPGAGRGGAGGGVNGGRSNDNNSPLGATQTDGYAFGIGGDGAGSGDNSEGRGAGGGGYYGGIGGTPENSYQSGSGGSGYVKGITSGNGDMDNGTTDFTGGITNAGQNTGNGKVVITFIPD